MSIEEYEEKLKTVEIDLDINEAEKEYRDESDLIDAREALSSLRRKYFG